MESAAYTLMVSCSEESMIVRSGSNLSRLTTVLHALSSHSVAHGSGKIVDNKTGQVVRSLEY